MKQPKQPALACPIDAIRASAHPMVALVAFMKATNLLHRVMRAVSYRRIATVIEMTRVVYQFGIFGRY